ncbi:caspase family protein [Fibrella forsythiae]|uniref:Caspase family protein n=1 Tax=Fibrella forsythiae TaxID=2817061 RepID=A0ABS3JI06_9BACT|nr:caspase family protein [Fibrella forsythiae]MBO0949632.1 caspase family protein [Fibrella forsythiae]
MIRYVLLTGLLVLCATELAWATKRALLIEIGHYPPGRDSLHTARDRYWMTQTLQQQAFTDVLILQDRQASAKAIRKALGDLINHCKPGDKVIIHYGGHGTQLPDQNGDETLDQKDEALVPYDAPLPTTAAYNRSNLLIRDDELGEYLDRLRNVLGKQGHVLILIDACHSGSLSRGQARIRTDNIGRTAFPINEPGSGWFDRPKSTTRTARPVGNVVMISGAQASQKQYEIRDDDNQWVGPVSLFFNKAMQSINDQTTYLTLFGQIKQQLKRKLTLQNPTIEGDSTALLLGGDLVIPSLLTRVKLEATKRFRLMKGMILGYTKGSTISVKLSRGDDAPQLLTGQVVQATPLESVIELLNPVPDHDSITIQTDLATQALQPGSARVTLFGFSNARQRQELNMVLQQVPGIQLVNDGADWLIRSNEQWIGLYQATDGLLIERFPVTETATLATRVKAHAQANWLRDMDIINPAMQVAVELVPVRLYPNRDTIQTRLPIELLNGLPVLRTDQQAWLTVSNVGTSPFYFSLIDILPDAGISVGIPNNRYPAASLGLKPGESRSFPMREITPPMGLETYKLLLSRTPVALKATVQTRGARSDVGAEHHPLSILVASRLRGSPAQSLLLNEAGTGLFQFWVAAPKH